jgi:hypothetical protein
VIPRSRSRRQVVAGLAAAIVAMTGALGPMRAATPDPVIGPAWPLDTTLAYRWATGAVPPTAMRTAIAAGAADATATRRSRAPGYAYASTAVNAVSYGTSNPCGVNGLACMRRDVPTGFGVWFRENGHRYDWGTLQWCELTGSPNGCFRAETVMLDELGHVDGLDHHVNAPDGSDYADAVVQAVTHARPQVGWNASAFARCDVATLQQLYDVASWTTPYSTCLDVPTVTTLAVSPTSIVSPASATFTATLQSDGTGRLDGNPMAGRVVVLQQRSGTGWADLVTMTAGSTAGSYVAKVAPKGTQDYRALFRKPSAEGVRTSASGTVRVTVTCTTAPCPLLVGGSGQ